MELLKKHIHRNQVCCRSTMQFTLDDDFNVPDAKPDLSSLITARGNIHITEERNGGSRYYVKGELRYQILYLTEEQEQPFEVLTGEIPFEEGIHMEEECDREGIHVHAVLEDLSASMIHSRKYSVKSLLRLNLTGNRLVEEEGTVQVQGDDSVQARYEEVGLSTVAVCKKETYRYRESVLLSSGKPEMERLLYSCLELRNVEFRMLQDAFQMKGEMNLFVIYEGESDGTRMAIPYEQELPLSANVAISGITEDMIPNIHWKLGDYTVTPQSDNDGEERILEIEAPIDFTVLAYEEQEIELLRDLYSTEKKLKPICKESICERLCVKNHGKLRMSDRIRVQEGMPRIVRDLHTCGDVKVDVITVEDGGLKVEGVADLCIFYQTGDSRKPISVLLSQLPFQEKLEVPDMKAEPEEGVDGYFYEILPSIDQIATVLLDAEEIEVKIAISLDTLVMQERKECFLVDVEETPFTEEELLSQPAVSCYFVQKGDRLWDIAKAHGVSLERIRLYNEGTVSEPLPAGSRLLLVRETAAKV